MSAWDLVWQYHMWKLHVLGATLAGTAWVTLCYFVGLIMGHWYRGRQFNIGTWLGLVQFAAIVMPCYAAGYMLGEFMGWH